MKDLFKTKLNLCIEAHPEKKTTVIKLLSESLGCHTDTIMKWRRGESQVSYKYIAGIAQFFGKPTEYFTTIDLETAIVGDDLKMYQDMVKYLMAEVKEYKEKLKGYEKEQSKKA